MQSTLSHNMKNTLLLGCAFLGTALAALGQPAAIHRSQPFINGQMLVVSNNVTVTNGGPNTPYISPIGSNVQVGFTNGLSLSTNGSTVTTNFSSIVPNWANDVVVGSDANGNECTNYTITAMVNYTNIMLGQNQYTWPFNNTPTNYFPMAFSNTNAITLVFVRQTMDYYGATNFFGSSTSNDFFTWTFRAATNGITISTNVPIQFLVGASRIRLLTAACDNTTTSSGAQLNQVTLDGFVVHQ